MLTVYEKSNLIFGNMIFAGLFLVYYFVFYGKAPEHALNTIFEVLINILTFSLIFSLAIFGGKLMTYI